MKGNGLLWVLFIVAICTISYRFDLDFGGLSGVIETAILAYKPT